MENLTTQNQALTASNAELVGWLREVEERVDRRDTTLVQYEARVDIHEFTLRHLMEAVDHIVNTWANETETLEKRARVEHYLVQLHRMSDGIMNLPALNPGISDEENDEENDDN